MSLHIVLAAFDTPYFRMGGGGGESNDATQVNNVATYHVASRSVWISTKVSDILRYL